MNEKKQSMERYSALPLSIPQAELDELCRRYQVRKLSLFGSVLRDDFTAQSDVDVLIEFYPEARVSFLTLARIARELSKLFGRKVDLVPRTGLKPSLEKTVLQNEQVIYEA